MRVGVAYGNSVNIGVNSASSFLWQNSNESHALPYTEVYLRLPPCAGNLCSGHGTCEVVANVPVCTCDEWYSGSDCQFMGVVDGTSCLDIHTRSPALGNGTYGIDPDDSGPLAAFAAYCDMTTDGGGWTTVGFDNFESGTVTGWSSGSVETSCAGAYTKFLGGAAQFGLGSASERVFDLKQLPHTQARVTLDYLVLDSWDGEQAIVQVDGATVYNMQFSHGGGSNVCGGGFSDNGPQAVVNQGAHTTNSLTVRVTSTLDQDPGDESFGFDNVRVMVR